MLLLDKIKMEALSLDEGQTTVVYCPFCNVKHEKKLYVTRMSDRLAYQCKRASCGASGYIGGSRPQTPSTTTTKTFKPRNFDLPTKPLSSKNLKLMQTKYEIDCQTLSTNGVVETLDGNQLVFPIYLKGKKVGVTTKRLSGYGKKSMMYKAEDTDLWYEPVTNQYRESVWVVEGCLDALKLNDLEQDSIALLGTSLPNALKLYLQKTYQRVIMCLDPDAVSKQRYFSKSLRFYATTKDVFLKKDPKDLPLEELRSFIPK